MQKIFVTQHSEKNFHYIQMLAFDWKLINW